MKHLLQLYTSLLTLTQQDANRESLRLSQQYGVYFTAVPSTRVTFHGERLWHISNRFDPAIRLLQETQA